MPNMLRAREITAETLTPEVHRQFLNLLIQDWAQVGGVSEEKARSMMETHRTLGDEVRLREVIGETSTKLCFIDTDANNPVAAAMVGERKYGDDQYYMDHGFVLPIIYQAMRLRYKAHQRLIGQPPRSREASIFAWGVEPGFETPALATLLPWMQAQYPYTRGVVVDVDTKDTRLATAIDEVTRGKINPAASRDPIGTITFGEKAIPQTFQRVSIPYRTL